MGGARTVVHGGSPLLACKKINRSHTHTPTENNTPDTDSRVNLAAMCGALEVYWMELGGAGCPWGVV